MDNVETRHGGDVSLEVRGVSRLLRGYAIVFDSTSVNLGGFVERISPSAVDRTLADRVDLRALFNHDPNHILGRMTAGTLRVVKDGHGLRVEIDPPETSLGHDIIESVRRRDITEMSFAFHTLRDTWDSKTTPPTRTVTDAVIREVSLVGWGAYPQTEVALRSLRALPGRPSATERLEAMKKQAIGWGAR